MDRTSSSTRVALALLFSLAASLTVARSARADVVGPPPESCPPLGTGSTCHGGPYCAPDICTTEADCAPGQVCRDVSICVGPFDCTSGYGTFTAEQIIGACGASCLPPAACATRHVCTPAPGRDAGSSADAGGAYFTSYGCGCGVPGGNVAAGAASLVIAAICGVALRRSRRRK